MAHKLYEFLINKTPSSANKFYGNIVDIDAPNKGILKLEIKPGQIIKKGDIIGMIDDVEVIAPDSGIVLRSVEPSMILKGERICSIALECIKQ
jgi:predicted deacylase